MRRIWDLMKAHKKASFGAWILVLVAGLSVAQWQLGGSNPIVTQVLGAQAKKPDVTPPSVSISFPANNGVYGPSSWAGSVSGSAADATGVAKVEVRLGTGSWVTAQGTTSWSSPLALPTAEGSYIVSVQATDSASPVANPSSPVTATFRVDRTPPATPVITAKPDNPSFDTKPHLAYSDIEAGVTFQCQLDNAAASACGSSIDYNKPGFGDHTFTVWAFDAAGNRSPAASYTWTLLENKAFGITDTAVQSTYRQALYPGGSSPVDLQLSNPYNFTIRVTGITVTATGAVKATHQDPRCSVNDVSTSGLITRNPAPVPPTAPTVDIPANSSRTLSSYLTSGQAWPADWPTITMANSTSNQDDCKDTTFTLSYSGTAIKP